ncbi:MAG: response regulator transcription factor [Firmicutes bacterium]|nr:response regulator transcription factor [Bacillota bacterium]
MTHTVLVIDDEPLFIELCRHVLEQNGEFEVIGATTVEEAEQILRSHFEEVVLLDVLLGGITGFQLIPLLRRISPESRLLLISSAEDPGLGELARQAGADGFLPKKALGPQQLAQMICG